MMTVALLRQLFVYRKIVYIRHLEQGGFQNVADDFAAVAVAQPSTHKANEANVVIAAPSPTISLADRADRGVELLSRWAGILIFAGVVAGIAYLIF